MKKKRKSSSNRVTRSEIEMKGEEEVVDLLKVTEMEIESSRKSNKPKVTNSTLAEEEVEELTVEAREAVEPKLSSTIVATATKTSTRKKNNTTTKSNTTKTDPQSKSTEPRSSTMTTGRMIQTITISKTSMRCSSSTGRRALREDTTTIIRAEEEAMGAGEAPELSTVVATSKSSIKTKRFTRRSSIWMITKDNLEPLAARLTRCSPSTKKRLYQRRSKRNS